MLVYCRLQETAQNLKEKLGWEGNRIAQPLKTIAKIATMLKPRSSLHLLADDPDNRILECAMGVKACFMVTGGSHLLSLKLFEVSDIFKLSDFLEAFGK